MNFIMNPAYDLQCCKNCKHWKVREWKHCQNSGPYGGKHLMLFVPECEFVPNAQARRQLNDDKT